MIPVGSATSEALGSATLNSGEDAAQLMSCCASSLEFAIIANLETTAPKLRPRISVRPPCALWLCGVIGSCSVIIFS
jgi:hypothetical protein